MSSSYDIFCERELIFLNSSRQYVSRPRRLIRRASANPRTRLGRNGSTVTCVILYSQLSLSYQSPLTQVLKENLKGQKDSPTGDGTDALDQPGLKDMTLKAIDILQARTKKNEGWFMMSEAASIDKMMHALDYDRALGELLELDDTIRASIERM